MRLENLIVITMFRSRGTVLMVLKMHTGLSMMVHVLTDPRIIVDLNASKTPNKFGRDTFLLQRVAGKGVMPYGYNEDDDTVNDNCSKTGSGFMCAAKLMREGWDMKDDYPW